MAVQYKKHKKEKNLLPSSLWTLVLILGFLSAFVVSNANGVLNAGKIINTILTLLICVGTFCLAVNLFWRLYRSRYFKGKAFEKVKGKVADYVRDCNELNNHIEHLKNTALIINRNDYGRADFRDVSQWNINRPELKNLQIRDNIYNCSKVVCENAKKEPFKYVCKYFGVPATEESLHAFETILNSFESVEDGKKILQEKREAIFRTIIKDVPSIIRFLAFEMLEEKLGLEPVDLHSVYFPQYIFQYVSAGGKASTRCTVTMNPENLNRFIIFLSEKVKFQKSAAGQRAIMTSRLRSEIKERDNYTCQNCGIALQDEPHLLLEVDHIIPISKGGITAKSNLQTLCWRCNRTKGAKL